jgi:hypothetical protein
LRTISLFTSLCKICISLSLVVMMRMSSFCHLFFKASLTQSLFCWGIYGCILLLYPNLKSSGYLLIFVSLWQEQCWQKWGTWELGSHSFMSRRDCWWRVCIYWVATNYLSHESLFILLTTLYLLEGLYLKQMDLLSPKKWPPITWMLMLPYQNR